MITDLIQFLRDRLDDDETITRAATDRQPYDEWDAVGAGDENDTARKFWSVVKIARMEQTPAARDLAAFIAEHDPARVLREINAKRQIAEQHRPVGYGDVCLSYCHTRTPSQPQTWPCLTLRLLALPYADHPDYREEWRP